MQCFIYNIICNIIYNYLQCNITFLYDYIDSSVFLTMHARLGPSCHISALFKPLYLLSDISRDMRSYDHVIAR